MSGQHTPGPWQIGLTANRCQIYTRSGYSVGFAREEFGKINGTTAEANARLIAAAPDLLALAHQYRNDLRHPPTADSITRRLAAIDAVLAKVKGE